jgi:hypothetical protein
MTMFFVKLFFSVAATLLFTCFFGAATVSNQKLQSVLKLAAAAQSFLLLAVGVSLIWIAFP